MPILFKMKTAVDAGLFKKIAEKSRAVLLSELLLLLAMAPLATLMARGHGQF